MLILVGESNPRSADPRAALFPAPAGSAGHRLMHILGLSAADYIFRTRRVNLCHGRWDAGEARLRARALLPPRHHTSTAYSVVVLLGSRVASAFRYRGDPFTRDVWPPLDSPTRVYYRRVYLPHPSGRCRAWNDPAAAPRARALLRDVCTNLMFGSPEEYGLTQAG